MSGLAARAAEAGVAGGLNGGFVGVAVLIGLALGVGLWLVVSALPSFAKPSLQQRVAPYVLDVSSEARALVERRTADPLPVFGLVLAPVVALLSGVLDVVLGGRASARKRLRQSGSRWSLEQFRARQLLWGAGGMLVGAAIDVGLARTLALPVPVHILVVLIFAAIGVVTREWMLQRAARARLARITEELPTVLEFLTLSLSAGESILDSLRRVSRISRGELAGELALVVGDVATGIPLATALRAMSDAVDLAVLARCVDQLIGALERGTPIVEVLRAQAGDVRDDAKRQLLETAGQKEVAMLVPLVFLILPVTILFAIWPGVLVLQMGF